MSWDRVTGRSPPQPTGLQLIYVNSYMKNSSADGAKSYPKFERCLKDWEAFKNAAINDEAHWFKNLLRLWRPSGQLSEEYGLRLAIRNNYLNFYRLGQFVASVACVRGKLVADVHYKYVLGEQSGYSGPLYLRLNAEGHFSQASNARS
jgi:hypothetical protein